MKYLTQLISLLLFAITPVFAQTAYETDTTNFYVDNSTNKALYMVNMIICMMNGTAPDKMVNRGPYVANVYDDECEQERDNSGDQSAAAPTSAGFPRPARRPGAPPAIPRSGPPSPAPPARRSARPAERRRRSPAHGAVRARGSAGHRDNESRS